MTYKQRTALHAYRIAANAHALSHRMALRFADMGDLEFARTMQETSRLKYRQMVDARKRYREDD